MKFYYHPASPNCFHILALADHLGISLEKVSVNLFTGETRTPEFLKMNPNGKVPVLVDGDFNLWESNAIMQYLAEKVQTPLWPKDDKVRVDIARWQFWQQAHWTSSCGILLWERLVKKFAKAGDPDPAEEKRGEEAVKRYGEVLNTSLEGRQYLVGDQLSLADFSVAAPLVYTDACRLPVKDLPHLQDWYGRMAALEEWKNNLPQLG